MYNMQQLSEAQHAVYVISNPDGSDAEFVPLKLDPAVAASIWQDLRARWAGRNLSGSGVAGLIHDIPTVMLKEEPSDFLLIVRLTAAFARYLEDAAMGSQEPQPQTVFVPVGDSVAWCERLWSLQDSRPK
jgi:hypothetical protein